MAVYSSKALMYFLDPAHAGEMEDPDGVGPIGDPTCGDYFVMFVRVRSGRVADVRYQIYGCPAAIASCEAVAEMAIGKRLGEVARITDDVVAEFKRRFFDTERFFDRYAKGKFGQYLLDRAAEPPARLDRDVAAQRVEESLLFIEAAHACEARLSAVGSTAEASR